MAAHGPAPKPPGERRNRRKPLRGEWKPAKGEGWQHGEVPKPPDELSHRAVKTWGQWMAAWYASYWTPDDLPGLTTLIRLWDQCDLALREPYMMIEGEKGETAVKRPAPHADLRQFMDIYGVTPKGQQDRRWVKPDATKETKPSRSQKPRDAKQAADTYAHLRVVDA